jgi:hypothetical protein
MLGEKSGKESCTCRDGGVGRQNWKGVSQIYWYVHGILIWGKNDVNMCGCWVYFSAFFNGHRLAE